MQARMKNPVMVIPAAMQVIMALRASTENYYDDQALASLIIPISTIKVWNRINVATKQVAGEWLQSPQARALVEGGR